MGEVCLTFDGGNNNEMVKTAQDCNENLGGKSCIVFGTGTYGRRIGKDRILDGHTVDAISKTHDQAFGNHTDTHLFRYKDGGLTEDVLLNELLRVEQLGGGNVLRIYRPPLGLREGVRFPARKKEVEWVTIKGKRFLFVRWDVDSLDWMKGNMNSPNYQKLLKKIEKKIQEKRGGDVVVLLHNRSSLTKRQIQPFLQGVKRLAQKYRYQASCRKLLGKYHRELGRQSRHSPEPQVVTNRRVETASSNQISFSLTINGHTYTHIIATTEGDGSMIIDINKSNLTSGSILRKFPKISPQGTLTNNNGVASNYQISGTNGNFTLHKLR